MKKSTVILICKNDMLVNQRIFSIKSLYRIENMSSRLLGQTTEIKIGNIDLKIFQGTHFNTMTHFHRTVLTCTHVMHPV